MAYRKLTNQEIETLRQQGCLAENWSDITVHDGFTCSNVYQVMFSGQIRIGDLSGTVDISGLKKNCGIFTSSLHNCVIGDKVYISNVKNLINYHIENNVVIENTGSLSVQGESAFGNGTEIEILNEGGGRELPIIDELSAQLAYMVVLYRHDQELIARLKSLIKEYTGTKRSMTGKVGSYSRIYNTTAIYDVNIGPYTTISGASLLKDGTIISCKEAPVYVGEGIMASHFIVLSGSKIAGGAFLEKCFVGQGVKVEKQYSAENCAFFANTEVGLGEGCSIFAGPYTVSHHKSTLLLAGMFSFYNGGSGTNISNHMYKMGPVHQGIVERGSKTGSSSYLLWPCRIGAYNVVVGKHYNNLDTQNFPFSYITEEKGKSILYPAMNLFTVGTRRDSEKWPARDKRKDPVKLDLINFNLFNPYIAGKIVNAIRILDGLSEKAQRTQEYVSYKGLHIPRLLIKTTRKYYEMALKAYLGNVVAEKLESIEGELTLKKAEALLGSHGESGHQAWCDLAGMFAPAEEIEKLTSDIKKGGLNSVSQVLERFQDIYSHYDQYALNWCSAYLESETGGVSRHISRERLTQIIDDWQINAIKLNNMILQDATKEFDQNSRFSYGIDGDERINTLDFEAVRGSYEGNKFVAALKAENKNIERRALKLKDILQNLK